jgi:hypothetical protein
MSNLKKRGRKKYYISLTLLAALGGLWYSFQDTAFATDPDIDIKHTPPRLPINHGPTGAMPKELTREEKIIFLAQTDHVKLLEFARDTFKNQGVNNYTWGMQKMEKINGKRGSYQTLKVKFTQKPFRVAIAVVKGASNLSGDRFVYVEGKYPDKKTGRSQMIIRPTHKVFRYIASSVARLPDCAEAKKASLRPITDAGFINAYGNLLTVYKAAIVRGECVEKFGGEIKLNGKKCIILERHLPVQRNDYPAKLTQIYIELDTLLPLRIVGWDWSEDEKPNCDYIYNDIKLNVRLTAADFTPRACGIDKD